MKTYSVIVIACILSLLISVPAMADIKLPAFFSDNMVLQQQMNTPVWGWAEPGEKVTVKGSWRSSKVSTKANEDGKWMVKLKTPKAGGPYDLTISGNSIIEIKNVLIGEVWICSGQSNMEMGVGKARDAKAEFAAADYPNIRLFNVVNKTSYKPESDVKGEWLPCSPKSIATQGVWGGFSATAYFFGRELHKELDVPIGLISTNWGGTCVETWTSLEVLRKFPEYDKELDRIERIGADYDGAIKQFETDLVNWKKVFEEAEEKVIPENWLENDFDDSQWKTKELLGGLSPEFDGVILYRKEVEIPESWAGKELVVQLGYGMSMDITWFNGIRIGATRDINEIEGLRRFVVPAAAVKAGRAVIAVKLIDSMLEGGIEGSPEIMTLRLAEVESEDGFSIAGDWRQKIVLGPETMPEMPISPETVFVTESRTLHYNAMIAPLISFGIQGAIWYQGESNTPNAYKYRELFPAMIGDWRTRWGQGNFPFYYVQIAPFEGYEPLTCAELCESQTLTLSTPNTGMAVIHDIGDLEDIHPANKQDIGKRLALWAMAKDYGKKKLVFSGPIYKSMKIKGDKIRISFDYTGSGLMSKGGELTHFTIAGADKKFVEAKATLDGDTVIISSDEVSDPVAVRFAWSNTDEPNLFNKEGLPASLFRTDAWPGVTDKR